MLTEQQPAGQLPADTLTRPTDSVQPVGELTGPSSADPEANYLVRHWRGELSLPLAYWVNGVALSCLVFVLLTQTGVARAVQELNRHLIGAVILAVLGGSICLGVWQCVGIWRSARKHVMRGGSRGWALAAQVVIALGFLRLIAACVHYAPMVSLGIGLLALGDPIPQATFRIVDEEAKLEVTGGLPYGTANTLKKLLDQSHDIRVVQLNSIGGYLIEGERMGQLIQERGLSTLTVDNCVSACLLAFMGGKERLLGPHGRLGFHEAHVPGASRAFAQQASNRFRQDLLNRGLPSSFLDRAFAIPPSAVWYPGRRELLEAGVITAVRSQEN